LSAELLAEIKGRIKPVKPLFPGIAYSIELVEDRNPSKTGMPDTTYCLIVRKRKHL